MAVGQSLSQNQFGETSINAVQAIGGAAGPILVLPNGIKVYSVTATPNLVITAPKGSIALKSAPTDMNDLMYVNTDGATAWTAATLDPA